LLVEHGPVGLGHVAAGFVGADVEAGFFEELLLAGSAGQAAGPVVVFLGGVDGEEDPDELDVAVLEAGGGIVLEDAGGVEPAFLEIGLGEFGSTTMVLTCWCAGGSVRPARCSR
jgi:hypothetical protein